MIRTISIVALLLLAVLFLPLAFQIACFVIAVLFIPHRLALFIPAVVADVLYAPTGEFSLRYSIMTLGVVGLLVLYWIIMTQTRFAQLFYGVEKK